MASNLVVVGYRDGRREKGSTFDFVPTKGIFHLESIEGGMREIQVADLKAIFFVQDFAGNPKYDERKKYMDAEKPQGRKVEVTFVDGEILVGSTLGYDPKRPGFFLFPVDPKSNNIRVFAISPAVKNVRYL